MTSLLLICWTLVAISPTDSAEPGWPQWRGPTYDGISLETDLVDGWPTEGPNSGPQVLWTQQLGQGYSGFAVVGDRVYTQSQSLTEQAVICLNADTGAKSWSYRYGWPSEANGLYPGPKATPTWSAGRVYFAAPNGVVGCLNATDGTLVWSVNPKREFHGRGTDFGCSCSPLVVDGKVIVPVGGPAASVVALSADDGSTLWKSGDAAASYCTPVPIIFRGQQQVLTFLENTLAAFDVRTGQRVWNVEFSQGYDEHAAAPLYQEPYVLVASPFRSGGKLLKIEAAEKGGIEAELQTRVVWDNPKFSNDVMSSLLVDGFVYGFDLKDAQSRLNRPSRGEFRCLDYQTGKIQWSTDQVGQANIISADGKLILFNDKGEVILAEASPKEYRELSRAMLFEGEVCWTPPALHRGRLYLRNQGRAVCLYLGKRPLDSLHPVQTLTSIPRRWRFDINLLLSGEREFPATTPEWDELRNWYVWSVVAIVAGLMGNQLVMLIIWVVLSLRSTRLQSHRSNGESNGHGSGALPEVGNSVLDQSIRPNSWITQRDWDYYRRILGWGAIFLMGCVGSSFLNPRLDYYVFSWPLSLWAGLQMTLMSIAWAERQADRRVSRRWSRVAGLLLMALSLGYYGICRKLGLSIEWGFLIGYLPMFPVGALCSYRLIRSSRWAWILDLLLAVVSFSVYFWAGGIFLKWWLVVGS